MKGREIEGGEIEDQEFCLFSFIPPLLPSPISLPPVFLPPQSDTLITEQPTT